MRLLPIALVCSALLLLVACGRPAEPTAKPSLRGDEGPPDARAPECAPPEALDGRSIERDVDGDGVLDVVVVGSRNLVVYVRRGGSCLQRVARLEVEGSIAFVTVREKEAPGMRDLVVDTWLHHGDRRRTVWSWAKKGYVEIGLPEEVPGPGRRR